MLKEYLWVAERQENGTVHFYLSDHSRVVVEINHMVPRGYFDAAKSS